MSFTSLPFLLFFAATLALYYTIFRKAQHWLLLVASIIFYCFAGPKYILYVLAASFSTWFFARSISCIYQEQDSLKYIKAKALEERKIQDRKRALRLLRVDFLVILGVFLVLKYFNFLSQSLADLVHAVSGTASADSPVLLHLVLPLGLSYYTFTNIGYILDVFWRKLPAEKSWFRFLLFTIYFPHILQGPIDRYGQLAPQFEGQKRFDYAQVTSGMQLMLWGYFKKMVIADRLNLFVSEVYDHYTDYYGIIFPIATILYSVQIYADFSGCMDIAGGASEAFGISLAKNFEHPYFSRTIPEFWRRWHITLGSWFKDYVFFPVSRSELCKRLNRFTRKKWGNSVSRSLTSVLPLFVVWLLTGIWHGAAWKYVVWGLFHGGLIIGGTLSAGTLAKVPGLLRLHPDRPGWKYVQMARTFTLCCIGRVFFRADNLSATLDIFRRTLSELRVWILFDGSLYTCGLDRPNFILAVLCIILLYHVSRLQERISIRKEFAGLPLPVRWVILYTAIFSVLIFGIYGPGYDAAQFIYNNF